ncbi:MAG TPA: C40 family peptidase [Caulobacteraceae bacterium]|nr:C40 family peptidase [Caulobacteraceae bacterium]
MSDPRTTLARPDLAAADLQGLVRAAAYAATETYMCVAPAAALRRTPDPAAEQLDQLLFGEAFDVLEIKEGWAWGQARRDGYVGFVAVRDLAQGDNAPTHRVSALRAYGFSKPDIKSAPVGLYSLNALVRVVAEEGRFAHAEGAGWFASSQLSPIGVFETDPAAVAERYLGAPYQWGGRESLGLDCSGLVQQALYACGRACPRDSDQQAGLGHPVTQDALRRGDLVFWRGHVGMMLDAARMIHANAWHMQVSLEPLADALARIGPATAFRRPA